MKNKLDIILLLGTFFSIILTQYVQQDISVLYGHLNSNYPFIIKCSTYKNSIMSYFFNLFDLLEFSSNEITIFISILLSLIAIISIFNFGYHLKKMSLKNICFFICMLYFLEKLKLLNSGFNYPLNIIIPGFNTGGSIGFICSIFTIIIFISKPKIGLLFFIPLNLFIHPTLGLLVLSYLILLKLINKEYQIVVILLIQCVLFLYFNYDIEFSNNLNLINFIHLNDFHRRPIEIQDLEFLIFPIFLTLLCKNKKELIPEWAFTLICIFISYLYYNIEFNFLKLQFLSLMPSRGANIGVAMIFIKSCADFIINPKMNKFIYVIIIASILNQVFYSSMQLTSVFIGCIVGLIFILFANIFKIKLISIKKPNKTYEVRREFLLGLLLSFIIYLNLMSASVNINQMVYDKPKSYDQFFSSIKEKSFYIDLIGDYSINKRNQYAIPLIDLSTLDALSFNPNVFNEGNKIFNMIFKKNLWDVDLNNSQSVKYKNVSNILEKYSKEDWERLKDNNLKYILCPSSSKLILNRVWEDDKYAIYGI